MAEATASSKLYELATNGNDGRGNVAALIEYLRRTKMTSEEIANRLGYSDAANFRRAFTSWTGKNPSDFRIR